MTFEQEWAVHCISVYVLFLFFTISIWLILILEREDKQTIGKWNIIVIDAGMNAILQ